MILWAAVASAVAAASLNDLKIQLWWILPHQCMFYVFSRVFFSYWCCGRGGWYTSNHEKHVKMHKNTLCGKIDQVQKPWILFIKTSLGWFLREVSKFTKLIIYIRIKRNFENHHLSTKLSYPKSILNFVSPVFFNFNLIWCWYFGPWIAYADQEWEAFFILFVIKSL